MSIEQPKVSVGLAVYNGEKYLEAAIESILAQTYRDFELILSDNASTDRTAEICKKYAEADPRIRYQRNPANIGGANNENLTFTLARGEYFRWAAHDDLLAPTLLEKCVEVLDRDPGVVVAHTMVRFIDEDGKELGITARNHGGSPKPYERFRKIACADDFCEEIYGVIRAEVLAKTRLELNYTSSDRVLLSELSLHGRFYEIPEPLFSKRFHPGNVFVDWRARMAWFDPKLKGKIVFPFWMQFFDYFITIHRVPLSLYERFRCYLAVLEWVALTGGKSMVKDILVALYMLMHTPEWRRKKHARASNWT